MKHPSAVLLTLLTTLVAPCSAQQVIRSPELGKVESFQYRSMPRANSGPTASLLAEKEIRRAGAGWLQVEFGSCQLSTGSWIEIYSRLDHETEILDATRLAQQAGFSLYFNGDAVRIRLYGGANTQTQSFSIKSLGVGFSRAQILPTSLCGTDSRYRVNDRRIARLIVRRGTGYTWCTAFLISSTNCFATSGNCMAIPGLTSLVAQFNVPNSTNAGGLVFPSTVDQYVWMGSGSNVAAWQSAGVGNDWGVFKTIANSSTRKHAGAAQGSHVKFTATPAPNTSARLTGYGVDNTPITSTGTQQSSIAPHHSASGYRINYAVDTMTGCSGAPVENAFTALAYGVNTHEFCSSSGGYNSGTAGTHPSFAAARARLCSSAAKPDLGPGFFYASSRTLTPNQTINVQAIIVNRSTVSAPASTAGYYISKDAVVTSADLLVSTYSVPALGANRQHQDSRSVRMPANLPSGSCLLAVLADPLNRVAESNEGNNYMGMWVACKGAPQPDLQIMALQANQTPVSGRTVEVSIWTTNRGAGQAGVSNTGVFFSRDSTISTADYFIGSHRIGSLYSNQTWGSKLSYSVPAAITPGTWYLGAYADYDGKIAETVETNNWRSAAITVKEMSSTAKRNEFLPILGTMATTRTYATASAATGGQARMCIAAPALRSQFYLCAWSANPSWTMDALTTFSLSLTNTPIFHAWFGRLDTTGRAYPVFNLPRVSGISPFNAYTKTIFVSASNFTLVGVSDNVIRTYIAR